MSETETTTEAEEAVAVDAKKAVGELLRDTRTQAGFDVADVARATRISQRYLEALEEGRSQDLPGLTYAIGFVRSYAEHLNLDGEEIVRRYKSGAKGIGGTTELVFPKPIPDSGVPGAAVLGIGVVLAAVAYGVWYWNSNSSDVEVARVEAVPEHMAGAAPQPEPETPMAESAPQPAPSPMEQDMEQAQVVEPPADVQEGTAKTAMDEAAAEPVAQTAPEVTPQAEQESAVPVEVAAEAEPIASEPAAEAVAEPAPVQEAEPQQVASTPEAAASEPVAEPATAAPPAEDGPSRITVRAKSNSWIQVRDEALDRLLFTRLLREGDEYEVPNRAGLRLMTGNAGALELLVDGKPVPAIGGVGEVRRNVELDPEKLKSGSAVTE